MKVKSLEIRKGESYRDEPLTLFGVVTLVGEEGEIKTRLSNASLGKIFDIIRADVIDTSRRNANGVKRALEEASNEHLLIEHDPDNIGE